MRTSKTMRLTLVRAPNDEASFSPGYQMELRQFYSLARAEGDKIRAVTFRLKVPIPRKQKISTKPLSGLVFRDIR
jgi:hypothetical protein